MVWFLGMVKGDGVPVGQYGVGGWRGWLLSMLWFTKNVYLSDYKSNILFCCFTLSLTSRSRRWLNWRRWGWCRTMRYKQKQIVIFSFKYKIFITSAKLLSLRNLLLTKNCFPQIILWKNNMIKHLLFSWASLCSLPVYPLHFHFHLEKSCSFDRKESADTELRTTKHWESEIECAKEKNATCCT